MRLAALQVASWSHPVTSGLPSIDLYLSSDVIDLTDAAAHYTETLVRLPVTGVLTRSDGSAAQRWRGPPRTPGRVRFALCHQPMKFDPALHLRETPWMDAPQILGFPDAMDAMLDRPALCAQDGVAGDPSRHPDRHAGRRLMRQRLAAGFAADRPGR